MFGPFGSGLKNKKKGHRERWREGPKKKGEKEPGKKANIKNRTREFEREKEEAMLKEKN